MGYVDLKFRPDEDKYIITKLYVESNKPARYAAEVIAAESSVGTWTETWTSSPSLVKRLGAKVYCIRKAAKKEKLKGYYMKIAYPLELFEGRNIPQLLADVAGNIYGVREVKKLKVLDVSLPKKYMRTFPGPLWGLEKIRKYIGTSKNKRPHVGTIIKPKVGLSPKKFAEVAYLAWKGGLDFVKDDENLTSHKFCKFEDRVIHTLEAMDRAREETGEKKLYSPNITGPYDLMLKRADFVKEHGGNMIMIDILVSGYAALQGIRSHNILPIHAHRAMHAALDKQRDHGLSMPVIALLARLAGVDQLHIDTGVGKMGGDIKEEHKKAKKEFKYLTMDIKGIKKVLPVTSGGLYPNKIYDVVKVLKSTNFNFQAGGGVHGHPDGTEAGAAAMRAAAEAVAKKIPLKEMAKQSKPLSVALKHWGGKQVYYLWESK